MGYYNSSTYHLGKRFAINGKYTGNFNNLTMKYTQSEIVNFMLEHNYSDENFAIMAGDEDYLRRTNPGLFKDTWFRNSLKDSRTHLQYCQDLVSDWIYEDKVVATIEKQNPKLKVELNGGDKERCILGHKITNNPDFKIFYKQKYLLVEMAMSHGGYCYNQEEINFRNNKRLHLVEQNSWFLQVDFSMSSTIYALLKTTDLEEYTESTAWGKKTDCVAVPKNKYQPISNLGQMLEYYIRIYGHIEED